MERLKPKLYAALVAGLLYDSPRVYLNVHTFGSICSFYYNVVQQRFFAREYGMITSHPQQIYTDKLLPSYLLDFINSESQFEISYELQHTSVALPFQHFSPMCSFHLNQMRDSLVFQIYFVMFDSIFLIIIISVVIYSTVYFFIELKKGAAFREKSSSASAKKQPFWTSSRIAFLGISLLTVMVLMAQIIFAIYWLVIDFDGVFLVEIIRYFELFYFYSLVFHLTALSLLKLLQLKGDMVCVSKQ